MTVDLTQWGAAALGLPALLLIQSRFRRPRLVGNLLGLASQPFWIWGTWQEGKWGWLALSTVYFFVWARGAWKNRKGERSL